MPEQQYCLRWNLHQPNFVSTFSSLLKDECLVDVTLAADGKYMQAHKIILSASSVYFRKLFSTNPCQHPIVVLKDVTYQDLQSVIDFIYHGEIDVSRERLDSVLKTAVTLEIKGLTEVATTISSEKREEEQAYADFQSPAKRRKFKKYNNSEPEMKNMSNEVEIVGPGDLSQKPEIAASNAGGDVFMKIKEEVEDRDYRESAERNLNPTCSASSKVFIKVPSEPQPSLNESGISVITGVKKRGRLLIRQGNVIKPTDVDIDNDENNAESSESKRSLIRQYSDPTPQQNQSVPDSYETSATAAKKSNYLAVTNSHLQKQNSDSALTVPRDGQQSTLLTDLINDPIKFQHSHPKSNHCPTLRPGPALGCNFCWNTIDLRGRILRRKTKYHCLECRTNLCIVPCFQDYHHKKESEMETTAIKENVDECSTSSLQMSSTNKSSSVDEKVA